ncbi:unnamed protein product [Allacma fusca]|uniref:Uncharacterized protein n=2 Tax=Allacma fusca TaxID=39272 RepID=A0A8J2LQ31_9HEXA|nr:unnamed protein product [Allacma fusca]
MDILDILQDSSNLIIGIEKITAHRYLTENGTLESDPSATDVWFYAVDPISDYILEREHPKVAETIMSRNGSKIISYYVSSALEVRATEVRKPLTRAPLPPAPVGPLENDHQWAAFPAALVALAGLIFIVGVGGICFICYKWSRYTAYKNQVQRIVISPRYDPVYMEHSPSLKEYETQVLQMRVNAEEPEIDDSDLQVDLNLTRNHMYNINAAGHFLAKDSILGQSSPSCHTEATTRPASDFNYQGDLGSASKTPILKTFQHHSVAVEKMDPSKSNPIYERSDDEDGVVSISSHTNENVHFKEKREYVQNIHSNKTTEL